MSTRVLIADAIKPSLVMSSEIFKDKIPGATIYVASTGEEAVTIAETENPDLCLVDFDLPDVDGPSLVVALRKVYKGPILMTAYPDNNVEQAVLEDLFAFNDASAWIRKPVRFDQLSEKIDKFLVEQHRTGRRFTKELPMRLIAKAAGRGKRAPKADGTLLNLSMGGACVQLDDRFSMKKKQELTLSITLPPSERTKARSKAKDDGQTKIRATVAWMTKEGQVGLQFGKLSDIQLRGIEEMLRAEMDE